MLLMHSTKFSICLTSVIFYGSLSGDVSEDNSGTLDILLRAQTGSLQRINENASCYDPLHYLLTFPYGTPGRTYSLQAPGWTYSL